MRKFNILHRWGWTFLVAITVAFGLAGCDGDDGAAGAAGAAGAPGTAGTDGQACWDLNGNGVGDLPDEDINGDGVVDVLDCGAGADPVAAAIASAKVESCSTCHGGVGDDVHQAEYNKYVDASAFEMTFTNFTSTPDGAGGFDVVLELTILKDGVPFTDYAGLEQKRFFVNRFDSATNQYFEAFTSLNDTVVMVADGDFVISEFGLSFDPTVNGQVYGYIADDPLLEHAGGTGAELPAGTHVHLYDNVANTGLAFGDASVTDPDAYVSAANVSGCENCHGTPYMKHGYRAPEVAGLPDFAACKVCHNDDGNGGHTEWQYMVDEPFNWATGVAETADYSYIRNVMNDTHMSHAMEFPYPMSMANCNTCHEGKLAQVLDDSQFTAETCQSCHPIQGIDAWPGEDYFQPHRAPAFNYLWTRGVDLTFHDVEAFPNCVGCHGAGIASSFDVYHTGYDASIYDASGQKYSDLFTVSVDNVTISGDLLSVNFSSSDPTVVPELLISFYGWDSKHYIVGSHERDANPACSGFRPGCKMEYVPESSGGSANPLFTEDAASVPGDWMVTLDMSALQLTKTDLIPQLIADGVISKAEISITPELEVGGTDVVLEAVSETFDLAGSVMVADYFQGANATVDIDKCNACHDTLASSFHDGSGRGGDSIQVCKTCHTTTFPGSHIEMASRSIDSYVHAIHSFQPFDLDDVANADDPVLDARNDQHLRHIFPNFTIRNCEACHVAGTFNVPDQSKSMPGLLSASWDIADRNIGTVPETVTGPASRACGGCHRARIINRDLAGDLASFNAHTEAFGTLAENDADDEVTFGIIDKIMSLFE